MIMMMMQENQEQLHLVTEKRKMQTEMENKRRQLDDDRRTLQHLKSQAVREQWLLEGAPSAGPDQTKTRTLEETITRLEKELVTLETEAVCQTITHTTVSSISVKDTEVKGLGAVSPRHIIQEVKGLGAVSPRHIIQEVKVHSSPRLNNPIESMDQMKRVLQESRRHASLAPAVYSVEITVERDRHTGETRVLSTNTKLPVDLSQQGVKVYEDDQKVVHEMNGDDAHPLSCFEVNELISKADEASMMSQTMDTVTSLPTAEVQEEAAPEPPHILAAQTTLTKAPVAEPEVPRVPEPGPEPLKVPLEITGLEAKPMGEPTMAEASAENPVTMVFMGYQSVEDEAETKRVLGLEGTVKAELVIIDDANGKTSPGGKAEVQAGSKAQAQDPPPSVSAALPLSDKPPADMVARKKKAAGETAGKPVGDTQGVTPGNPVGDTVGAPPGDTTEAPVKIKKGKQPCKCCSIM